MCVCVFAQKINKDNNIHKSEALKWKTKRTLTHVGCQNLIFNYNICIKGEKIVSKFVAKLLKCMILFKDILTFLGLYYRAALLITL